MTEEEMRNLGAAIGTAIGLMELALDNVNSSRSKKSLIEESIKHLKEAMPRGE